MPKQAYAYLAIILLGGAFGVVLAANLLKVQASWVTALNDVKEQNAKTIDDVELQREKLLDAQETLTQVNLGWDRYWNNVQTVPNPAQGTLQVSIGSDNGLSIRKSPSGDTVEPILYAFQPTAEGGFEYVGPFVAREENIRQNNTLLEPFWRFVTDDQGRPESAEWRPGQWRFRTQIPAAHKIEFDSTVARFATDLNTFRETQAAIRKQDESFKAANEQLERRNTELLGTHDANAKVDPLRPELTTGLVSAIAEEEEARNALQVEVDALRRSILQAGKEQDALLGKTRQSGSAATTAPRLGRKPE